MIVEFTQTFDTGFQKLEQGLQKKCKAALSAFLDCYVEKRFPKSLRVHKCGPFLSLSLTMKHRVLVSPIRGGLRFVFAGDHDAMDRYLKRR